MLPFHCRLQAHFEKVKMICDTTTLPLAMHHLSDKITSQLDISKLTDKLRQGKVDSSALTPKEKYDTWEEIKIKSMIFEYFLSYLLCAMHDLLDLFIVSS
jgi:hypothetical protein